MRLWEDDTETGAPPVEWPAMSQRLAIAYGVWLASLFFFFWINQDGSEFVSLLASLAVLSGMTRWVSRAE